MVRRLEWDSDFFFLRIGKTEINSSSDWEDIVQSKSDLQQDYDLLYVFCEEFVPSQNIEVNLVDTKTIYAKQLSTISVSAIDDVKRYECKVVCPDLYRLALVSGKYSRFQLDKHFPENAYERLYKRWIEQSVNGSMADSVFVHISDKKIDGMITVSIDEECAHIGLVAVDDDAQGKGIGSKLIQTVETYLIRENKATKIKVATQWDNVPARRLYEKNGFEVEKKTNIYHWWL